ncbi:hypothetical protein ACVGVM_01305 [Pseudonocardia bannensis]|uniref:Uncharacterized protein n=1 Tax=Pseudonocardia bannensis TaxID=630973 RepID=A0A848DDF2_9PSEU|nr:hypothetical protein [Pseudonocardia bannensis]NMH90630.1 hypothetical protein [Pseudonocardia bannensis]
MDEQVLTATRRSLHGIAEMVLAGPQYREHGTIRLRVTPGGFGQVAGPLRVEGTELVWDGDDAGRVPLRGTCRELGAAAGVEPGPPEGLYTDTSGVGPNEQLVVDPAAAELMADWFATGDHALRNFVPGCEPVLWPEHFDLGIQLDEIDYGVSAGDAANTRPYAYVAPWTPCHGPFWNAPFGAIRRQDEVPAGHLATSAIMAFFVEGRKMA